MPPESYEVSIGGLKYTSSSVPVTKMTTVSPELTCYKNLQVRHSCCVFNT